MDQTITDFMSLIMTVASCPTEILNFWYILMYKMKTLQTSTYGDIQARHVLQ